jgi:pilus assembly protein CpaF
VGSDLSQEWADDWADEPVEEIAPTDASHSRRATALDEKSKRRSGPTASEPQLERAAKKDTSSEPASPEADLERALRKIHQRLLRLVELWRTEVKQLDDHQLSERTRQSIEEIVSAMRADGELPPSVDTGALIDKVLEESLGLGPIADLLDDNSITEIMVNNAQQIFVERDGKLELSDRTFSSDIAVRGLIERIVASVGHRVDDSSPMVDARLDNGSRVSAIIPPLSIKGPTLTIRKLNREPLSVDDLVASGTLTADMAEFLELCVKARRNILIAGGTGSGKTTTLNVLANCVPDSERIITIEETAELKLEQAHVVSLEARPPNSEGKGAIAIRDLIRAALRMRPDRIVIGESRGGETLDMLQAMSTGHEGSLATMHANSLRDALSRLETMVLMSGMDLPSRAIRDQIASAINIIVQQARFSDGSRRITHISEITGVEQDTVRLQEIFVFEHEGFGTTGRVSGRHRPTGSVPSFYETLDAMGIPASVGMFQFQE